LQFLNSNMSGFHDARLRTIQRLEAGLDPDDADIDILHDGPFASDEVSDIQRHLSDIFYQEKPKSIYASEAPTWYKRVGVGEKLQGLPIASFLSLTKKPESWTKTEQAARTIWVAATGVVRAGEQIIAHSDTCIREEAGQIHQGETPRRPLEELRDMDERRSWAEPWQRVLMFFVRTQVCRLVSKAYRSGLIQGDVESDTGVEANIRRQSSDNWQGPRYRFTAQQQAAWDRLSQAADEYPIRQMRSREPGGLEFRLNPLELACLQFCVELLDQHYQASAFECALVCALAALGYDQDGWLPLNSYVDILSKAIRIGQSFVVQHTLLLGSDSEDLFDYMKRKKAGYRTGEVGCEIPSPFDRAGMTRSELLYSWVKTTTVVGTKSPMDWMIGVAFEI
jgi:hypothetical protein